MNILDTKAIDNLRDLQKRTGKNLLQQLATLYIDTTPAAIQSMRSNLISNSLEDLAREAHTLKSSSANIGARGVEELARTIEHKIIRNESYTSEELASVISQIESEVPKVYSALKELN